MTNDELPLLRNIHADFYASDVSTMETGDSILVSRPYGSVDILWRKQLGQLCRVIAYVTNQASRVNAPLGRNRG